MIEFLILWAQAFWALKYPIAVVWVIAFVAYYFTYDEHGNRA